MHSLRSRMSTFSNRKPVQADGSQLQRIDEACLGNCDICNKEIADEEDLALNDEINQNITEEDNVKSAYNEFRKKRGLAAIDFSAKTADGKASEHRVQMCIDCLLECFQAKRMQEGDIEFDEVSAYRGSIMQGIGLTKHGHY